jgi:hypothetical protein
VHAQHHFKVPEFSPGLSCFNCAVLLVGNCGPPIGGHLSAVRVDSAPALRPSAVPWSHLRASGSGRISLSIFQIQCDWRFQIKCDCIGIGNITGAEGVGSPVGIVWFF